LRVVKDKHSPDIAKQVEKLFKSSSWSFISWYS
jgi:hypothetical protein